MRLLKENNENMSAVESSLPVSFLTDFISDGWEKVGYLKADIEAVQNKIGTEKIQSILQDLLDAYLICIGQLEETIQNANYLDVPTKSEIPGVNSIVNTKIIPDVQDNGINYEVDTCDSTDKDCSVKPVINGLNSFNVISDDPELDELAELKKSIGLNVDEEDAVAALERLYLNG